MRPDGGSSSPTPVAAFVARGDYDRHLRAVGAVYHARRDRLLAAIDRHLPELTVTGYNAGVHMLMRLPTDVDDRAIADRARQERIEVPALSSFCIKRTDERGLVIGHGAVLSDVGLVVVRASEGTSRLSPDQPWAPDYCSPCRPRRSGSPHRRDSAGDTPAGA